MLIEDATPRPFLHPITGDPPEPSRTNRTQTLMSVKLHLFVCLLCVLFVGQLGRLNKN